MDGGKKEVTIDYDSLDKLVIGPAENEDFEAAGDIDGAEEPGTPYQFYAIKVGDRSRKIIHYNEPIYESYEVPYMEQATRSLPFSQVLDIDCI